MNSALRAVCKGRACEQSKYSKNSWLSRPGRPGAQTLPEQCGSAALTLCFVAFFKRLMVTSGSQML
jgi:hypothetical protein